MARVSAVLRSGIRSWRTPLGSCRRDGIVPRLCSSNRRHRTAVKSTLAFIPPKPKLLHSAARGAACSKRVVYTFEVNSNRSA